MIEISPQPIDTQALLAAVQSPTCGAAVLFVGSTRQWTDGQQTESLYYECYEPMAVKELTALIAESKRKWNVESVAIAHRMGEVGVGQASIAVAVASPHRADAFAAAGWLMDEIKSRVPIWKREKGVDGQAVWVHPHPTP